MLGLFDSKEEVVNLNSNINSAPDGLREQPLPLFYVWLDRGRTPDMKLPNENTKINK